MIHEFRNLLAVIVNYSELIADETDNPEAVKADIQEVRTAAERAIALTAKLPRNGQVAPSRSREGPARPAIGRTPRSSIAASPLSSCATDGACGLSRQA